MTETRVLTLAAANLRSDGAKKKIIGYAAVFDARATIGGLFHEIIRPGAFKRSLESGPDVAALVDHQTHLILGRRSAGTLSVVENTHGLMVEIDPPDTTYSRDLQESMRRGDVCGMSFRFKTIKDSWKRGKGGDLDERELLDVEVDEVSVVTFPAYPQTEAALRSRDEAMATWSDCYIRERARERRLRLAEKS